MSGSHMDGESILDEVNSGDTYAERVVHGPSQEPSADHSAEPSGVPNGEATAETNNSADDERPRGYSQYRYLSEFEQQHFHPLNVTPDRPCTAFFRAGSEITSKQIFDSLFADGIPPRAVRCLQRKPTGETMITFTTQEYCCKFLDNSAFLLRNRRYPTHPAAGELTFLTIYDAPYEMPDSAIEERLKLFCVVHSRRRGKLQGYPDVANGLRHYRVRLITNVPCYLRFGKFQLRFYHDGQPKTCRKCGADDHIARDCVNDVCFNCDTIGHVSKRCPEKMRCCICKSEQHKAIDCPLSWYRRPASHRDADSGDPGADPDPPRDSSGISPRAEASAAPSGPPPAEPEQHLIDTQGFLNDQSPSTDRPARPATVMPSSQDTSLLADLILSGSEDDLEDEATGDNNDVDDFNDVEFEDGEHDAEGTDDDEFVDVEEAGCVDNSCCTSPKTLDSLSTEEALPLAAAVKKGLPQRKAIGRRNPGKLSSSSCVPSRKPTTPLAVSSRKKLSPKSADGSSKTSDSENAPT